MTFGDKLREVLEQKEIMQKDLAKKINISKSSMSDFITNRRLPNIMLARDLAKELGVSVDYLLDYQPDPKSAAASPREAAFLANFRKLSKEKQDLLISLIEMLSEK